MKKILQLINVQLLNIRRNRSMLFATIAFPLIFIGIFGIAMPSGVAGNTTLSIGIIAMDGGIPDNAIVPGIDGLLYDNMDLQNNLLEIFEDITFEDDETLVFDIKYYNANEEEQALSDIQQMSISAVLKLSDDFSLGIMASFRASFESNQNVTYATNDWVNYPDKTYKTSVVIRGDPTTQKFSISSSIMESIVEQYFMLGAVDNNGLDLTLDTNVAVEKFSMFDYILPGLVIFGIFQNLGVTASFVMRDVESGLLRRLRITKVRASEYTLSLVLSQLMIALVQIPIFFGVATLFGFPASSSLIYAFVFAILVSLSVTGLALIVASLAKDVQSASSMATMVAVPLSFLAGAFFGMPKIVLIENVMGDNSLELFDFISAKPAIENLYAAGTPL